MRLWSVHPSYLDVKALVAVWREGLLARKVLLNLTRCYRSHPQLIRFRHSASPLSYIDTYLYYIYLETQKRHYHFDYKKLSNYDLNLPQLLLTSGQLEYEFSHLKNKLQKRSPQSFTQISNIAKIKTHPLFRIIKGEIEEWEVV